MVGESMTEKRAVTIKLSSESGGVLSRQTLRGELYDLGNRFYVRYKESDPVMGNTRTTVKCEPGEIKVVRHGDVESEQTFQLHKKLPGTYRTSQGGFSLQSDTHSIQMHIQNFSGFVAWRYDLFIAGEFAGTFALKLEFMEGE